MSAFDLLVFLGAVVAFAPCLCRLILLQWWRHKPAIIILHGAMAIACAAAALNAWHGDAGLLESAVIAAAFSWLVVTFPTWKKGVPPQFHTRPSELSDSDMARVSGRGE